MLHNSGHPSMGTMHAEDVETMIRRLETNPINLSPSLVESMDAIVIMTQVKISEKPTRRVKSIAEIIKINQKVGSANINVPFVWNPANDKFFYKTNSYIFEKLITQHGISKEKLDTEFRRRTLLLHKLYIAGISNYKEVHDIITTYYKTPERVLKKLQIR